MVNKQQSRPKYQWYIQDGSSEIEPLMPDPELHQISVCEAFHLADKDISDSLKRPISSLSADILEIGIGSFLVDCLSPRSQWKRDMTLITPVRNLTQLENSRGILNSAIEFLTGDSQWALEFVHKENNPRPSERDRYNSYELKQARVCLFSEGLDSFCGLMRQLEIYPDDHFFLVSAIIQNQIKPK